MIKAFPVSDLNDKLSEIEEITAGGEPVCLTGDGRCTMVLPSLRRYSEFTDTETKLEETGYEAASTDVRLFHETVFENARKITRGK